MLLIECASNRNTELSLRMLIISSTILCEFYSHPMCAVVVKVEFMHNLWNELIIPYIVVTVTNYGYIHRDIPLHNHLT